MKGRLLDQLQQSLGFFTALSNTWTRHLCSTKSDQVSSLTWRKSTSNGVLAMPSPKEAKTILPCTTSCILMFMLTRNGLSKPKMESFIYVHRTRRRHTEPVRARDTFVRSCFSVQWRDHEDYWMDGCGMARLAFGHLGTRPNTWKGQNITRKEIKNGKTRM